MHLTLPTVLLHYFLLETEAENLSFKFLIRFNIHKEVNFDHTKLSSTANTSVKTANKFYKFYLINFFESNYRETSKTMDRVATIEANDGKLNLSSSSLDSDSTSDTSFLGLNPLDDSKLREIEELRVGHIKCNDFGIWQK